jgi:hypothetical protein
MSHCSLGVFGFTREYVCEEIIEWPISGVFGFLPNKRLISPQTTQVNQRRVLFILFFAESSL